MNYYDLSSSYNFLSNIVTFAEKFKNQENFFVTSDFS
jgi:hypothetical protein